RRRRRPAAAGRDQRRDAGPPRAGDRADHHDPGGEHRPGGPAHRAARGRRGAGQAGGRRHGLLRVLPGHRGQRGRPLAERLAGSRFAQTRFRSAVPYSGATSMPTIAELLRQSRTYSFEFFPPRTDEERERLETTVRELEPLGPSFVSVTYRGGA